LEFAHHDKLERKLGLIRSFCGHVHLGSTAPSKKPTPLSGAICHETGVADYKVKNIQDIVWVNKTTQKNASDISRPQMRA
jgi:hypothetical protein